MNNPYISGAEGKKEWNDRYMNMAISKKNWQVACFIALLAVIILSIVISKLALSSRIEPFVIETNQGMPYALQPLTPTSLNNQAIINYVANQFIVNSRTVLLDKDAQKIMLDKVYAYSGDSAIKTLHDYYQAYNPIDNPQRLNIDINIINSMPLSKNTWQVVWDEIKRSAEGNEISKTRWMANLSYQFGQVNSKFIHDNPFGLYITNITWSQSVGG